MRTRIDSKTIYFLYYLAGVTSFAISANAAIDSRRCSEHFTCKSNDRTNDHLQFLKLNSSIPNWYELCNCDALCPIFGDCCADADATNHFRFDEWSFVKIRLSSKINFMSLMKHRCSKKWRPIDAAANDDGATIRRKCEQSPVDAAYDYLLPDIEHMLLMTSDDEFDHWHVTSRTTLTTYRNLYCAICNDDGDALDAWNQRLRCSKKRDGSNSSSGSKCTSVYYQTSPELLGKEKLKRTPLQNKVFATCNLGWYKMNVQRRRDHVLTIAKKCMLYYEPVVVRDEKSKKFIIFKNEYCAQCNDYDRDLLQCPGDAIDQLTQVPPSFSSVTNYDTDYRRGGTIPDTNRTCVRNELFNAMSGVCVAVDRISTSALSTKPKISEASVLLDRIGSSGERQSSASFVAISFAALFATQWLV